MRTTPPNRTTGGVFIYNTTKGGHFHPASLRTGFFSCHKKEVCKAYFYCRVAHDDSFSLEQQVAKLRRYAEQAGYTIVGVAAEHGSGLTLDRPALQELTEAVLAGKVDVVLVNSLDRLGRDWGMTKQYIDLLTEHKVKLLCVRERVMIDSSSFSPFFT